MQVTLNISVKNIPRHSHFSPPWGGRNGLGIFTGDRRGWYGVTRHVLCHALARDRGLGSFVLVAANSPASQSFCLRLLSASRVPYSHGEVNPRVLARVPCPGGCNVKHKPKEETQCSGCNSNVVTLCNTGPCQAAEPQLSPDPGLAEANSVAGNQYPGHGPVSPLPLPDLPDSVPLW